MANINQIQKLVDEGILGREYCPEQKYWHWPVLQPEKLPESLLSDYRCYDEIRWYGESS